MSCLCFNYELIFIILIINNSSLLISIIMIFIIIHWYFDINIIPIAVLCISFITIIMISYSSFIIIQIYSIVSIITISLYFIIGSEYYLLFIILTTQIYISILTYFYISISKILLNNTLSIYIILKPLLIIIIFIYISNFNIYLIYIIVMSGLLSIFNWDNRIAIIFSSSITSIITFNNISDNTDWFWYFIIQYLFSLFVIFNSYHISILILIILIFLVLGIPINSIMLVKLIFTALSDYFDIVLILTSYVIIIWLFINIIKSSWNTLVSGWIILIL